MRQALAAWLACLALAAGRSLPIYIEDNHASAFEAIVRTVDIDEPHLLVMVDAHSDASAVDGSDHLRTALRRVSSTGERLERVQAWRRDGTLQAYNWIEPLMPAPIARVRWLDGSAEGLEEAHRQLDDRPGTEARDCGTLGPRYERTTLENLGTAYGLPVIATIDLDTFAGMEARACEQRFDAIWKTVLATPDLRLVTFAISRPWLADDAQAERLLTLALTRSMAVANSSVHFQPFGTEGPDRSELAKQFYGNRRQPPRFDITAVSPELRRFLVGNRARLESDNPRWKELLDRWAAEDGEWRITAEDLQPETDGIIRADCQSPPVLRVTSDSGRTFRRVRWFTLQPEQACYNVLPELVTGKVFAADASPYVREIRRELPMPGDGSLPPRCWQSALPAGWGRLRITAEIELPEGGVATAPPSELRITTGSGFRAGLSEEFGMPYVFGAGFLRQNGETGPETAVGSDCANFLVYAWRRAGIPLPWCNPGQLRQHLDVLRSGCKSSDTCAFDPAMIDRGLVVHLGSHVAAVWEDKPPLGVLTGDDLVAHHLGGLPEVIPLKQLLEHRTGFDLLVMPAFQAESRLGVAGDVNLSAVTREEVRNAAAVFGGQPWIANLEGAVGSPRGVHRYEFTWPEERLGWLKEAGCAAVCTANNHAADGDSAATRATLRKLGIGSSGSGPLAVAAAGWQGRGFAIIAVNLVEPGPPPSGTDTEGVLTLPEHESEVREAITDARAAGQVPVVFAHWGREFTGTISSDQSGWARRFVKWGAAAVIGSHPHVSQKMEFYRGRPIVYSMGDFIWESPRKLAPPVWLEADARGRVKISYLR